MGILTTALDLILHDAATTLGDRVHVTSDTSTIRPALTSGKPVVWIGAPESISCESETVWECEYAAAIISPRSDPMAGIDEAADLAADLAQKFAITRITPESLTLGAAAPAPAVLIHFTQTFGVTP